MTDRNALKCATGVRSVAGAEPSSHTATRGENKGRRGESKQMAGAREDPRVRTPPTVRLGAHVSGDGLCEGGAQANVAMSGVQTGVNLPSEPGTPKAADSPVREVELPYDKFRRLTVQDERIGEGIPTWTWGRRREAGYGSHLTRTGGATFCSDLRLVPPVQQRRPGGEEE